MLTVVCLSLQSVVYCHGGRIGFYQGDIRLLPDDMKALRPTIFPVVPRLLNRMYDKVSRGGKEKALKQTSTCSTAIELAYCS